MIQEYINKFKRFSNIFFLNLNTGAKEEIVNNAPIQISTFFLPYFCVGIPPKMAPITVPHKAMDMIKNPWKRGEVCQRFLMGRLAPEITTVSNPKIKPARAAVSEMRKT